MKLGIREKTIFLIVLFLILLSFVLIKGSTMSADLFSVDLDRVFKPPNRLNPFGTDWMGRDMLSRTIKGLSISMQIGILCSISSGFIALILGIAGPMLGSKADIIINWFVNLVLAVPHTLVVILISISCGGGLKGIVIGVTLTHWTSLTRVIRAEVMQLKAQDYIKISRMFGKSSFYIAREHVLPHVLPQLIVGIVLIFPHAILHEASITFLGFGLPSHEPAIGVILSEAMKYLTSGKWWLAFFPGISLVLISFLIDQIGRKLEMLMTPKQYVG